MVFHMFLWIMLGGIATILLALYLGTFTCYGFNQFSFNGSNFRISRYFVSNSLDRYKTIIAGILLILLGYFYISPRKSLLGKKTTYVKICTILLTCFELI